MLSPLGQEQKRGGVEDSGFDPEGNLCRQHREAETPALPGVEERLEQRVATSQNRTQQTLKREVGIEEGAEDDPLVDDGGAHPIGAWAPGNGHGSRFTGDVVEIRADSARELATRRIRLGRVNGAECARGRVRNRQVVRQ